MLNQQFSLLFFKEWKEAPKDFSLDLYAYFHAKRNGYKIKDLMFFLIKDYLVYQMEFQFKIKIKFIKRNFKYIHELKKYK